MKSLIAFLIVLSTTVQAGVWLIVDTRTTNTIPAKGEARVVDVADQGDRWQVYRKQGGDVPTQIPAWFDSDSGDYSFATNEAGADADFSAPSKGSPGRKALRQFMGKKVTPKNIRLTERELRMGMATATTFAIRRPAETNYVHFLNLKADYEESLTP